MKVLFFSLLFLLFVASLQDLKRREIDNWLNLLIFFVGFIFVLIKTFFYDEFGFLVNLSFLIFFAFFFVYFLYYAHFFSGGDCKLLFSLTPFFISINLLDSFYNFFTFFIILLVVSSLYGLFWILFNFFIKFSKIKRDFFCLLRKNYIFFLTFTAVLFFTSIFLHSFFFIFSFFLIFFIYIAGFVFRDRIFVREIPSSMLREGDWIFDSIKVKGKTIKYHFEGLSKEEVNFLKKNTKRVKIKEGIPLGPAFFFSFIFYYFLEIIRAFLLLKLGVVF
ncbi:MAG: prepilin peptidase [Candidatus Pacearchaeota archaeon]